MRGEQTLRTTIREVMSSLPNAGLTTHAALRFNEHCTTQEQQFTHFTEPIGHKIQAGLCETSYTKGFP